jgi:hypothetical protein
LKKLGNSTGGGFVPPPTSTQQSNEASLGVGSTTWGAWMRFGSKGFPKGPEIINLKPRGVAAHGIHLGGGVLSKCGNVIDRRKSLFELN